MAKKPAPPPAEAPKIDPTLQAIGRRMRKARDDAGLSGERVAELLGYTTKDGKGKRGTVSAWEKGRSLPPANKFRAMCILYGCSADELLWGNEGDDQRPGQISAEFRALLAKVSPQRRREIEQTLVAVLLSILSNGGNGEDSSKHRRAA